MTAARTTAAGLARFEDRGACTDAERRAAGWLHDEPPASGVAPRSRRPSDTLEHLDPAAGEAVLDFALACVGALDAAVAR